MYRLKILLLCLFVLVATSCSRQSAGRIVYLNGPSSSGKSTLAQALQAQLDEPYLHIGIDHMVMMMPAYMNNWSGGAAEQGFSWQEVEPEGDFPVYLLRQGPYASKIQDTFIKVIRTLALEGHNVIADDVAYPAEAMRRRQAGLRGLDVLYVGITAPLEELERRERARGDRLIGSVRGSYRELHKGVEYDLMIDTYKTPSEESVRLIREAIHSR